MKKEITKYCWVGGTLGMVEVTTTDPETEQRFSQIFIKNIEGFDEEHDLKQIAFWGAKLPYDEALALMKKWGFTESNIEID